MDTITAQPNTHPRLARRSQVVRWEAAAWAFTGVAWSVSAGPGVLVEWRLSAAVPISAFAALTVFVAWQVRAGAPLRRADSWVAFRTRCRTDRTPKSARALATTTAIDAVVWAGSGVGWCWAARAYGWSEGFTGAAYQLGVGAALVAWAGLGLLATRRIASEDNDAIVVTRRVLGTGPLTVLASADQPPAPRPRIRHHLQRRLINPVAAATTAKHG